VVISPDSYLEIESDFPQIKNQERRFYEITSDKDPGHNCVAYAVGDTANYWDPAAAAKPIRGYYWPDGCGTDDALANLIRVFEVHGYSVCESAELEDGFEKIAIFGDAVVYSHAAKQLPNGRWTSKLGEGHDIEHETLEALCGGGNAYGDVMRFMKRQRRPAPNPGE